MGFSKRVFLLLDVFQMVQKVIYDCCTVRVHLPFLIPLRASPRGTKNIVIKR